MTSLRHPKHKFFNPLSRFVKSKKKYLAVSGILCIFLIFFKNIFILLLLGIMLMIFDYFIHMSHFPLHIDPLFFCAILITRAYGSIPATIFILIIGILPEILTASFEIPDFISVIPIALLAYISGKISINIIWTGIIFSALFAISQYLLASLLEEPPHKRYLEPAGLFLINTILFVNIGKLLLTMMTL